MVTPIFWDCRKQTVDGWMTKKPASGTLVLTSVFDSKAVKLFAYSRPYGRPTRDGQNAVIIRPIPRADRPSAVNSLSIEGDNYITCSLCRRVCGRHSSMQFCPVSGGRCQ